MLNNNSPYIITKEQADALRKAPKPDKKELEKYAKLFKQVERKKK